MHIATTAMDVDLTELEKLSFCWHHNLQWGLWVG